MQRAAFYAGLVGLSAWLIWLLSYDPARPRFLKAA